MSIDWDQFRKRTTFVLGSEKRAGKTTFLTYALARLRQQDCAPAYLSIGVDGEAADAISGLPRPMVVTVPGDFVVTSESALAETDASFELIDVFPERSVLGRSVLVRIVRRGRIELVGPENNRQIARILAAIVESTTAGAILADGAADRVTQVASGDRAGYVVVMRATPDTLDAVVDRARLVWLLSQLPEVPAGHEPEGAAYYFGPLTPSKADICRGRPPWRPADEASPSISRLGASPGSQRLTAPRTATEDGPYRASTLVLEDFTRVFLNYRQMVRFARRGAVAFRRQFDLLGFVVNLFDVTAEQFARRLGQDVPADKITFNPYLAEAPV